MARAPLLDRLSASDLFLLMWDEYGWCSDMGALAILNGSALLDDHGGVRIDALRRRLEPRLHLVPRFRQLLYRPRLGLGWPLWVDAPSFDLADHIRVHPLAAPADEAALVQACQQLARRRLDPARPLWELWLLPGLPDRRAGAYLKLHHAFADGAAGVAALGALLDASPEAPTAVAPPWAPTPIPTSRAQPHRSCRPGRLPRRGGVRPGRPRRPRRSRVASGSRSAPWSRPQGAAAERSDACPIQSRLTSSAP